MLLLLLNNTYTFHLPNSSETLTRKTKKQKTKNKKPLFYFRNNSSHQSYANSTNISKILIKNLAFFFQKIAYHLQQIPLYHLIDPNFTNYITL